MKNEIERCCECGRRATFLHPELFCDWHWAEWWGAGDRKEAFRTWLKIKWDAFLEFFGIKTYKYDPDDPDLHLSEELEDDE